MKQKIAKFIKKYILRQKISLSIRYFRVFILLITLSLLIFLWQQRDVLLDRSYFGYIGIFIVNFVSNATILLPLPGVASVFLGGALFNPFIVGVISAVGSTLGELFAYFLGFGGRVLVRSFEKENHWLKNIEYLFHRMGFLTIIIFSILPLPFFDFIGILAGTFNYPIWKFTAATFLGRLLRNLVIAFTGAKVLPE